MVGLLGILISLPTLALHKKLIGQANEFKEGDAAIGVAAQNQKERLKARKLLAAAKIKDLHENPIYEDAQQKLIWATTDKIAYALIQDWTLGELKTFLLNQPESEIKAIMPGLNSDVIACVVKLMSNQELIQVGQKIYNPLPDSKIGSKGYLGARIQPNSPTDNPEDITWQVFNGFSYAVGDVMLGTNPVDSTLKSVAQVEKALKDIIVTFNLEQKLPWSVLAHIDVQQEVEKLYPGSTDLFFQSIAGNDATNHTFGISTAKLLKYAEQRLNNPHAFYFETGQGSEFTNQQGHGVDMVVLESRKYGLARALKQKTAWIVVNDVAGFIGPEVFKSKEQLVRVCLEDIVMGKLHGLTIGLDICTTLHMSISLDDLQWCQDQIIPAAPAYLMALPTRNDPMLSYLTTSFRDHVRIRKQFNTKVDDKMWAFFKQIKIIDKNGKPTKHFGDPIWVYYQYKLRKGDKRPESKIRLEGEQIIKKLFQRGIPLDIKQDPNLDTQTQKLYEDAKKSLWTEWKPKFIKSIPNSIQLKTQSKNRTDYINHPPTGEKLSLESAQQIKKLRDSDYDIQFVISEGLNAKAIMQSGHLMPYLTELRRLLKKSGFKVSPKNLIIHNGRVRAGYQIGELLFANKKPSKKRKGIIHIIGERPGNGHQSFSAYITLVPELVWSKPGKVDHNLTKLVSGISNTSLKPIEAAKESLHQISCKMVVDFFREAEIRI